MPSESALLKSCAQQKLGSLSSLHFLKLTLVQYFSCHLGPNLFSLCLWALAPWCTPAVSVATHYHHPLQTELVPSCSPQVGIGDVPPTPGPLNTLMRVTSGPLA